MRCPFCAEQIDDAAVVCVRCRYDFSPMKPLLARVSQLESSVVETTTELATLRAQSPARFTKRFWQLGTTIAFAVVGSFLALTTLLLTGFYIKTQDVQIIASAGVVLHGPMPHITQSGQARWSLVLAFALSVVSPFLVGVLLGARVHVTRFRAVVFAAFGVATATIASVFVYQVQEKFAMQVASMESKAFATPRVFETIRISQAVGVAIRDNAELALIFAALILYVASILLTVAGRALGSRFAGGTALSRAERVRATVTHPLGANSSAKSANANRVERMARVFAAIGPLLTFVAAIVGSALTFVAALLTVKAHH